MEQPIELSIHNAGVLQNYEKMWHNNEITDTRLSYIIEIAVIHGYISATDSMDFFRVIGINPDYPTGGYFNQQTKKEG